MIIQELNGKRIASIDFGFKRLGVAICDELHISITPYRVFDYSSPSFWVDFINFLKNEKISALVVGYPYRKENIETEVIKGINDFILNLEKKIEIPIFRFDESFSTKRAEKIMFELGKKKKDRKRKENKDLISAAVILQDFIRENNL